jgi:NAD(P)-dependent dehydrogenase (short-subunit alcohol dehydrogenase family)
MARTLENSVVVITGASSGMGRAAALRFAEEGARVVLAARRSEPLEQAARECRARGAQALAVATDVTRQDEVRALALRAVESYGRIDVWINNAGVVAWGDLTDIPLEDFERVIQVNLMGCVHGARAVLPYFREQGEGVLINNASVVATSSQPLSSPYVASKWAVRGLSNALRADLVDTPGIRVCTLMPGPINTPLFQHSANFTGHAVQAPQPLFSPQKVAARMVELARRPRAEASVGAPGRLSSITHLLAPRTTARQLARVAGKGLFEERHVAPTHGNLFEPMAEGSDVTGGWQQRRTSARSLGRGMAGGLALLAVPALVYAWQRSGRRQALR